MSDHLIQAGSTGNFFSVKPRSSTTGNLLTGLTYSGFTCTYQRSGAASATTVTLSAGTLGTYSSGSIVETSQGGTYQFCPPNAAVAAGAAEVDFKFVTSSTIDATEHVILTGQAAGLPVLNSAGNVGADLQTIKTQTVTAAAGVTIPAVISSPGTAQTISDTTASGNAIKVDARRLPRNASEARLMYGRDTWTDLGDFNVTGATPTITAANAIRLSPSASGSFDQCIEPKNIVTATGAFDFNVSFTVVTLGGSAYGLAVGLRSLNGYQASLAVHFNPVANPNVLLFWAKDTDAGSGGVISTQNLISGTVLAVGDSCRLRLSRRGPKFTAYLENLTQRTIDSYSITNPLSATKTWDIPNTCVPRLSALGGVFDITSLSIIDRSPQFPLITVVGDSKTVGFNVGSEQAAWTWQLNALGPSAVYAGSGDTTGSVLLRLAELMVAPGRYTILNIGRNDLGFTATATWQANYMAIVAALKATGTTVIHLMPIPETTLDQSALTTFINTTYPSDLKIDVTQYGWNNSLHLSSDGVHPNAAGAVIIRNAIVGSGYILPDLQSEVQANVQTWAGTAVPASFLANAPTNWLTAAAIAAGALNNKGDWQTAALALSQYTAMQTAVGNINNLSALANLYGPATLEIPATGSIASTFRFVVKDSEGHQEDLTGTPTVSVTNAAGTDRSANLSAVTHPSLGVYVFTYTVQSTASQESLSFDVSGVAASDSTARHAYGAVSLVAVDTAALLALVKAKTDLIATNGADSPNAVSMQNKVLTGKVAATVAAGDGVDAAAAKAKTDLIGTNSADSPNAAAAQSKVLTGKVSAVIGSGDIASPQAFNNTGQTSGGYMPSGPGANACTIPLTVQGQPWVGAMVFITTDSAGLQPVAGPLTTNSAGTITAMLTFGLTYYVWAYQAGKNPVESHLIVAG